ncbi:MAG: hypothetical protein CVV30_08975 [Methanomicrobiales archaeon HGW-Methanomicrobiales-1]|jgi:PAS domain S-box-containing protein|nr:MAG: hypothetical protein CVV30_08975 [Methanomicrobiales archaeon HGW-Methanomicrobiales-1]
MSNILYVDDEPALLDLGKEFLEMSGHLSVETATTVEDALDKIKFKKFDAIISDYQMPDMSGIEFLQHLRSKHHDIPFILFTGRGREEIVIEALNCGADFYLQKGGEQKAQFAELEHKVKNAIDRKRTHDALKESEQRVLDIINFLPDATFAVNLENKVIAWNKMIEEMTGISKAAILGTGDYSYAVPFYGEKRPILVDLVLNNDWSIEKKYPFLKRTGDKLMTEIWSPCLYDGKGAHIGITVSPLYDTNGSIIGAIEAIRDVTERKEAEEKLKCTNDELHAAYEQLTAVEEELRSNYEELSRGEQQLRLSEERYRDVVEDQTEFICRFTPDGRLTFVNDAYCRYFGLDKDACLEKPHTVVLPPEDKQLIKEHFSSFTPEHSSSVVEHRIVMPTGEVRWQRWSDRAIFDTDGRIIEYQSVGRDTTDKITAEENLRRTNETLNAAYEQLTAIEEELRSNFEELSRNEQELRLSEERYRDVVEDQTEFICRFTPDGRLTFVNDAYCRYFGLDKDSCVGRRHTVVIPPEDVPQMKQHLSAFTPEHSSSIIEHRIVMSTGEVRWQRWSDRAIFDTEGRIIEYQSVGRDTTDKITAEETLRRMNEELHAAYEQLTAVEEELRSNYEELSRGEQELRLSEERYRDVVEDQTEFICRFTPDGRLTFVNDAYCRYFGLDKKACLEKPHTVVVPPEDKPLMKEHFSSFTTEHPSSIVEHRIVMPTGEVRWQRWSDRAIFDTDGRIIEYQSVGRDTTDKITAEEILRRTNEELHAAYEQLTATEEELRQNYDELGKSQTELHAAYEQLTATEEELRSNYEELARGEQQLRFSEERYRNVVEDQTELICRFAPDGTHLFVNDAYCRYFGKSREDIIDQHFIPDVPPEDHTLLKAHFASFSPDCPVHMIEHRIVMSTGEVRWQQWSERAIFNEKGVLTEYQSVGRDITDRKRTEYALNEVNIKLNLLSSITRHDILNQLTVLQGYCGLIEGKTADSMTREWILKATQASEVIRSQISFTQHYQDLGMQKPLWQDISLTAMIVCQNNGFSQVAIDEKLAGVEVFADPLLKTVFYHLFENAVMHGGKMTQIRVHGKKTPGFFTLIIEDDGDGISPAYKKNIFQKGYGKHTGLGLYLVWEVLSITGLTINETGEPGKGARFEIRVPAQMYRESLNK